MYQLLVVMFLLILLGVGLRSLGVFKKEFATALTRFVFLVTFPCLIFRSLHGSQITRELWVIPPLAYLIISLCFIGSFYLSKRFLALPAQTAVSFAMGGALGNTAFIGYPFVVALLGEKALPPAIFFDQMGNFLATYTVGVAFCLYIRTNQFSFSNWKEILKLPPFIAFLVALFTNQLPLPLFLEETINRLADATVPLTMVAIGISLSASHLSAHLKPLLTATVIKLLILPFTFWLVVQFVPLAPLYQKVIVLQGATPTLMTSYTLASIYQMDTDFSSSVIFVTTLVSFLTLPGWNLILTYL